MIWFEEIWNEMDYRGTKGKKGLVIEGITNDLSGFFIQTIDKGGWFTEDKIKIIERVNISSFPVFIMERNGEKVKVSLSSDEEGNDGGFAFIEGAE
ncbi:MAG: hypothetical protein O3B35_05650 [Proteobacteria bacterium]|nr:hypothetical protein [Pseudomonadota bacterium]